jgi:hypothetical protein
MNESAPSHRRRKERATNRTDERPASQTGRESVQLAQAIPAIWVYTAGSSYNATRAQGYGNFLTEQQKARLERIRQGQLLFDGRHRQYYLEERRTQFAFPEVRVSSGRGNNMVQLYITYNVLGLISLKSADLLFGEEPLLRVDDEIQQQGLAALVERSSLHSLFYSCAIDASYEGECFLEACVMHGQVYLQQIPSEEIFPQGQAGPDRQYPWYVRYGLQNYGTDQSPIWLLLETQYWPGRIERKLFQLDENGGRRRVGLENWKLEEGMPPLADVTETGIAGNLVTWVPNLLIRGKPVSDYDGAIELQDALNAKNSQVGRVLLKHSDPKMVFPEEAFDEQGNIRSDYEAFPFTDADKIPKYITWNAELAAAMQDRAFVLNQLLVRTETSPVLLGLKEGAAPDAYKKVRLESFNSITKAARKAAYWKAGIKRAVSVAQDLENTLPGVRYDRYPIGVELRDGIPVDAVDQAQVISLLQSSHNMSRRRAVEMQLQDPAAVNKELDEIEEDLKSATPSILMQEPPAGAPLATEADAEDTAGG